MTGGSWPSRRVVSSNLTNPEPEEPPRYSTDLYSPPRPHTLPVPLPTQPQRWPLNPSAPPHQAHPRPLRAGPFIPPNPAPAPAPPSPLPPAIAATRASTRSPRQPRTPPNPRMHGGCRLPPLPKRVPSFHPPLHRGCRSIPRSSSPGSCLPPSCTSSSNK